MARENISLSQRFRILHRDHFICQYCGRHPPQVELEVDHHIPVCEGGTTEDRNLITACHDCNAGKRGILLKEKFPKERVERYWAATECTCERPTCQPEGKPRDKLEAYCECKWCHGCVMCGSTLCTSLYEHNGGACWYADKYWHTGEESALVGMKQEDADACRKARTAKLARESGQGN